MEVERKKLQKWAKAFTKERDEAVLSFDVKSFRYFYTKWTLLGYYSMPLPKDDSVVMLIICKMAYHTNAATKAQKEKAKKWLEEHGFSTELN